MGRATQSRSSRYNGAVFHASSATTMALRPSIPNTPKPRWVQWVLIAGFWTLVALVVSTLFYFAMSVGGEMEAEAEAAAWSASWVRIFAAQFVHWGLWIAITPLILWLARRFPLPIEPKQAEARTQPRSRWGLWGIVHLGAGVGIGVVHLFLASVGYYLIRPFPGDEQSSFWSLFLGVCLFFLIFDLLIYWGVLGVGYAVDYYRRFKEEEVHTSQLETQLAQAQLQALKMQLHPHFLFNTLNAVSTLVRTEKNEAATDMIAGLSDLLRLTLESSGAQEVTLKQELEFLERYLGIEQIRFGDRLRVRLDIEPATLHARVPNLLLQPLVENAIRHGIAPRAEAGLVEIRAARDAGLLRLHVRDDGPGLPDGDGLHNGVGLSNTIARLERLYGPDQRVTFTNADGGALVTLELPFREF